MMVKAGSEITTILTLCLKLAKEQINNEIEKTVGKKNKASEFTNTHDTYEFYRGREEGLRFAIDCFSEVIANVKL
jgi:hypothetical protein